MGLRMAYTHDLIVIGAGSAGLTAAGGAAMFGLSVALIEAGEMGGDCLNVGCVPSKALIAAAARAQVAREATRFGVKLAAPQIDFAKVMAHVEAAIATIAPVDSQERFESLGVEVIRARARFAGRRTVEAEGRTLSAPRIVIATGSRPRVPDLAGLAAMPFLTNETLFKIDALPRHLLVLGGGAIGIEMAQAFRRLGAKVTVVEHGRPLAHDDPDAVAVVIDRLRSEGVAFVLGAKVLSVSRVEDGIALVLETGETIEGSHLLVAVGRTANTEGLGLDVAGVACDERGITVDARRRTTNPRIYAIGDCRVGPRFTHVSGYEGSLVAVDVAIGWPGRVDWRALPHVAYTDPELAQIGLTEAEARDRHGPIDVTREEFMHNDRAVTEGETAGFLKVIRRGRKVVGVTIVGARAGELLLAWTQVIAGKASMFALASAIVAYPSRAEIGKTAAFSALKPHIFGAWPKRWAKLVARTRRWF